MQYEGESLYDACQRYQGQIRMCPNHGQEQWLILQTFYKGLTEQTRSFVDSAAGGGIMNKTLDEDTSLIESMPAHNFPGQMKELFIQATSCLLSQMYRMLWKLS